MAESKCVVSAADFDRLSPWVDGKTYPHLGDVAPLPSRPSNSRPQYDGPERRVERDRRYSTIGGRRRWDRKS